MGEAQGVKDIVRIAESSDTIALGDIFNTTIRKNNNYSLLTDYGYLSTIIPSIICSGSMNYPIFPNYLSKYQTFKKNKRLCHEIYLELNQYLNGSMNKS